MSKRARRLWLGDWQRDANDERAQPADQEDTVTFLPDEEPVDEAAALRRRNRQRTVVTAVAIAVLAGLILRLTAGGDETRLTTSATQVPPAQTPQAQPQPQVPATPQAPQGGGFGAPDLAGPEATKAAQAALSRFPGDIERVTAGPAGDGYVVHVIQGDGNEVHVAVSDEFKVLGSDAGGGGPGFGGGAQPSGPSNSS
jgi:hypothetical protein